jgi:hypothetical protein
VGQGEALRPLVSAAMRYYAMSISSACSGMQCWFVVSILVTSTGLVYAHHNTNIHNPYANRYIH